MTKIVILAAGNGTRMGANMPKVLVPLKGKPIIKYLIESIIKSGVDKQPIIVVSLDNKDSISRSLDKYGCLYAVQTEQLGTGHALACAKDKISEEADQIICFYGDHPFISPDTIKRLTNNSQGVVTIMTTIVNDFDSWRQNLYYWGRIIRNHRIKEIVEYKDAAEEVRKLKEVNPGFYCFKNDWLWGNINKLKNNNVQREYYLTDLIKIAFEQGIKINSLTINPKETIGINTKKELEIAETLI